MKLGIIGVLILLLFAGLGVIYINLFASPAISVSEKDGVLSEGKTESSYAGWRDTVLTDIRTSKEFKISDFAGKPILLESFAVWCPTCLKQQKEIKTIAEEMGDAIIHISLDTDPNEDSAKVLKHVNRNDFDWLYAISPIEMTRELTKVFGITFVNAPSAPVVLICEDQSYRFLENGVKKSDELLEEIGRGCRS